MPLNFTRSCACVRVYVCVCIQVTIETPRGDYVILLDPAANGQLKQRNPRTQFERDVVRVVTGPPTTTAAVSSSSSSSHASPDLGAVDAFCANWSSTGKKGLDKQKLFPVPKWSSEWTQVQRIFAKVVWLTYLTILLF